MYEDSFIKDYSQYTFEEFLQDDFFIYSIKNPTSQTILFWQNFQSQHPDNLDEFLSAQNYILAIQKDNCISEEEITNLWNRISATTKKAKRKKIFYAIGTAAASIIIIFSVMPFFKADLSGNKNMDIFSFAQQTPYTSANNTETQLILSEEKIIVLHDKECDIRYDSTEIKTGKEDISKKNISSYNQLITPKGKRSILTFSDGTKMWVNAGSRVVYPSEFEPDKREIYVDGEIYIEVAKDKSRPFYVKTKNLDVKVLGTKFNVTAYESDNETNVVLAWGSVEVDTKNKTKTKLAPKQMFSYTHDRESLSEVDVEKYISWVQGLYYFESEELGEVFRRLSVYYGTPIHCSLAVSKLKCSGKLDLKDNLETVLKGLTFVAPINYNFQNGEYIIEKK